MSAAPAPPVFRDAAHRRAAMRSLVWRLPVGTLAFAALGPLIGMLVLFTPSVVINLFAAPASLLGIPQVLLISAPFALAIGGVPAAFTGFWVTLLATFTNSKKQLYAGSAAIGAASSWLCWTAMLANAGSLGSSGSGFTFIALMGAAAAVTCTFIFRNGPLAPHSMGPFTFETRNHRRNRLAKARAERLAKLRADAANGG